MASRFHLSLNVTNLAKSIDFYRRLFDFEPAKCHDDYAKFEIPDPPVVFSLSPYSPSSTGRVSRIGIQLGDRDAVESIHRRLLDRGFTIDRRAEGLTIADPDGNFWSFSTPGDAPDLVDAPGRILQTVSSEKDAVGLTPTIWEHFLTADLPAAIPHADAEIDEVRLTGTFNRADPEAALWKIVVEAYRVLRPGGSVSVHALVAERPFPAGLPALPALASMVQHVPVREAIIAALVQAGFVDMSFVKHANKAWFSHDGVDLCEVKIVAQKPRTARNERCEIVYRGPLASVRTDEGIDLQRGRPTSIDAAVAQRLRGGSLANAFLDFESTTDA